MKLARALEAEGVPIVGTTPDAIDRAEDRERFQQMIDKLGLSTAIEHATARSAEDAVVLARKNWLPLGCAAPPMFWVAVLWKLSTKKTSCATICKQL